MKRNWISPIILSTGIIGSTVVAKLASESRWLVLPGPLVMALSLVVVCVVDHRLHGGSRARTWAALILGAAFVLAGFIVVQRDPASVAKNLPIFGGVAAVVIGTNMGRGAPDRNAG